MAKLSLSMLKNKRLFGTSVFHSPFACYHIKLDKIAKRGIILDNMVTDKDRKKNWHFNILNNKAKARNVFENIHRPSRRQNVLNSLFIKNISDVIATGEIVPEVLGYGIEITGVKVSPCCKILNVFWQVPPRNYNFTDDITSLLNIAAPKIRAELISRNVMGRVPMIYFLRDNTNARIAAVEEAFAKLDLSSDPDSAIVPDDSFTKDMFVFRVNRVKKGKNANVVTTPEVVETKAPTSHPQNPVDMKSNVFGLNHDVLMEKILALKKKPKQQEQSAVITQEMLEKGDLFSNIPGVCFQADTGREKILKQFQIERKLLMQKKRVAKVSDDDFQEPDENNDADSVELERSLYTEDYVEDDDDRR